MSTRTIYKLVFFGTLGTGNEERQIECRDLADALKAKNELAKGRPYFSLTPICTVRRGK